MNSGTPEAWILILPLLLIVLGIVAAIIWRSWIVGGIVLILMILIPGLYFIQSKAVQTQAPAMLLAPDSAPSSPHMEVDPELNKTASVYPSLEEAAKNLTLRLCDTIEFSKPAISSEHIHLVTVQSDRTTDIVKSVLNDKFPRATIKADNVHDSDAAELMVVLGITNSDKTTKCLKFTAHQGARDLNPLETCAKDLPWVSDLDAYRASHPNGEWIVGWSPELEPAEDSARQQARQAAANQMISYVQARFPELNQISVNSNWLREKLENELLRRKFNSQEFVQQLRLSATGEPVYRAALLVDVSSPQLEKLHATIIPQVHRQRDSVRRLVLGTVGLGAVICVVYLFLNWATRGYFQLNLRLGAFLVLVAGLLLIMMIA
jgi:hypothetical protein